MKRSFIWFINNRISPSKVWIHDWKEKSWVLIFLKVSSLDDRTFTASSPHMNHASIECLSTSIVARQIVWIVGISSAISFFSLFSTTHIQARELELLHCYRTCDYRTFNNFINYVSNVSWLCTLLFCLLPLTIKLLLQFLVWKYLFMAFRISFASVNKTDYEA